MKIIAMHKVDAAMERGALPSQDVLEKMGAFIGETLQKGILLGGEGLHRSATRARLTLTRGEPVVERGPYSGRNELIAGVCMLRSSNLDEAIGWAGRLAKSLGEGAEIELGPIVEEWDLGGPPPANKPPPRFLALAKADAKSEAGAPFLPRVEAPLAEMKRANVLIAAHGLTPSSQGKRVQKRKDRRQIVDGPFAESKELIAGFAILDLPGWDEVLAFSDRFADILGGELEMDLRPLASSP